MATSEYQKKLQSPKWQKKRLKIFERDDFTCQLCQATEKTLHVHHLEYSRSFNPWDVEDDKLITYCNECHAIVELAKGHTFKVKVLKVEEIHGNCIMVYSIIEDRKPNVRIFQRDDAGGLLFITGMHFEDLEKCYRYATDYSHEI